MNVMTAGSYKDEDAVILENDELRVTVVPKRGAKTASIFYKPGSREILWQLEGNRYKKGGYGDNYVDAECSGFDDMFPSINRCFYGRFPWAGTEIPDHGEVWGIPWSFDSEDGKLSLRVYGVRLPYLLEKTVYLDGSRLKMEYRASNLSAFDMDFLWAAHPLFQGSPGMELIVPDSMKKIVNAFDSPALPGYGKTYDFPRARIDGGGDLDLSSMPESGVNVQVKYFFQGKVTKGWCILHDKINGLNIGLSYPPEKVPYLGVWMHAGGLLEGHYNFAPEPATAAMDGIDGAAAWGVNSVLPPHGRCEWSFTIGITKDKKAREVGEDGLPR